MNTTPFFRSSITGRTYNVDHKEQHLTVKHICKLTHIIYLITCIKCSLQYVGETKQALHARMNAHRSDIKKEEDAHMRLHRHFQDTKNKDFGCSLNDLSIQAIEYVGADEANSDRANTKIRQKREEYWIKELRTMYPYGLNTRYSSEGDSKQLSNIFNTFKPIPRTRTKKNKIREGYFSLDNGTRVNSLEFDLNGDELVTQLLQICRNNHFWPYLMHKLFLEANYKQRTRFHLYLTTYNHSDLNKTLHTFFLDITNAHQVPMPTIKTKRHTPSLFMKITFHNQSIENINLESIIYSNDIKETVPPTFKHKQPTIVYKYGNPIRNKNFNYVNAIKNIDAKQYNKKCACSESTFCHPSQKHIITGDLTFIQNMTLRRLLQYGPQFRIPTSEDWDGIFSGIKAEIQDFTSYWCDKEKQPNTLTEWTEKVLRKVESRITILKRRRSRKEEMTDILDNPMIKSALKRLHKDFVLVGADKANNNVIIICKQYYLDCIRQELSTNTTYEKVEELTSEEIVKNHIEYMDKYKFAVTIDMQRLPHFYGIPKMHKNPPSLRYIAASNKCTTKTMSSIITHCLKLVTYQHRLLNDTINRRTGLNPMLVIDNSEEVLTAITELHNAKVDIRNIQTYDFTTLYTNIPHDDLKTKLKDIIFKVFEDNKDKKLYVTDKGASWYMPPTNKDKTPIHILDRNSLYESICFLKNGA